MVIGQPTTQQFSTENFQQALGFNQGYCLQKKRRVLGDRAGRKLKEIKKLGYDIYKGDTYKSI